MKRPKGARVDPAWSQPPLPETYPQATKVTSFRIHLNFSNPKGAFRNPPPAAHLSFLFFASPRARGGSW